MGSAATIRAGCWAFWRRWRWDASAILAAWVPAYLGHGGALALQLAVLALRLRHRFPAEPAAASPWTAIFTRNAGPHGWVGCWIGWHLRRALG